MLTRRSECDSPLSLTNYTLEFLDREWTDEIDFVICNVSFARMTMLPCSSVGRCIGTGDSARYDEHSSNRFNVQKGRAILQA